MMARPKGHHPALEHLYRFRDFGLALGVSPDVMPSEDEKQRLWKKGLSLLAAAENLRVKLTTLKTSIQEIEKGVRGESGKKVKLLKPAKGQGAKTLSDEGLLYFRRVCDFLTLHKGLGRTEPGPAPVITVGAYTSLWASYLPEALSEHLRSSDQRRRQLLRPREYNFLDMVDAVADREVAFGVGSQPTSKKAKDKRVEIEPFGFLVHRVFICQKGHPLLKKDVTKEALADEVLIRLPALQSNPDPTPWPLLGTNPNDTIEVGSFAAILQFVRSGLGVSVVPYLPGEVMASITAGDVEFRALPGLEPATVAGILPRGGAAQLSAGARTLYEKVRHYFMNKLPLELPKG
jgi:DNA-binding transcriptional LysR family regulator